MSHLSSFEPGLKAIIIGASGGIGHAFVTALQNDSHVEAVFALSRSPIKPTSRKVTPLPYDYEATDNGETLKTLKSHGPFDVVIIVTGLLHNEFITPEKSARDLDFDAFEQSFRVNTFGPAITARDLLPLMRRDRKTVFAALSARVGSISDNRLGGWYAYRSSKAALNMILKTLSIEYARRYKQLTILGLQPGTVDTGLSSPFQRNVPEGKLFTPDYSAQKLLSVINNATPDQTGSLIAWDGETIPF